MLSEKLIGQALARALFAPTTEHLNRQKINLAIAAELDQKACNCAESRHAFEKEDLMRVQVVEVERIAPRCLRVVKNRAAIRPEHPAVIRLGLRLRHETPPVLQLVLFD